MYELAIIMVIAAPATTPLRFETSRERNPSIKVRD